MFKPQVMNRYNVYKKGRQLIGVASEVTLPEVTNLTDTLEGAGTGGTMEIPVIGLIDNMEMEIAFSALCDDIFSVMDPRESTDLSVNGALQGQDSGTGAIVYKQFSASVRGTVKKFAPGTVKAGGKMDSKVTLNLSYYKLVLDGKTKMEVDRLNGVYIMNGKDIMEEIRGMC